jgi:hypothetical protein
LQPIIKKQIKSYISNSTDLILKLIQINNNLDKNCCLLTADVENLYPSIEITDGLLAIKNFLNTFQNTNSLELNKQDIECILECATFIIQNNYLEFGNSIWKQIKGTAMGTPFAVTYACIYMHEFEQTLFKKMLNSSKCLYDVPIYYFRYIDDIFGIFQLESSATNFVNEFNNLKENIIKLKITSIGNIVEILDLIVSISTNDVITTKLYQKPNNMYLYLPPSSFHQPSVFKSFIQAEIKRYLVCCSNEIDFNLAVESFKLRLLARGFGLDFLNKVMNINIERNVLLKIATQKNNINHNKSNKISTLIPIIFKSNYCERIKSMDIKNCLKYTESLWSDPKSQFIFNSKRSTPIVSYKRSKNLKEILITSKFLEDLKPTKVSNLKQN